MPITKTDIQNFGTTLKDTLTAWGEQIQYGRDVAEYQKIQNKLSNIKSLTTNSDGSTKPLEDIGKTMFQFTNEASTKIKNPTLMQLAHTTIGQYFKTALTGAENVEKNRAEEKTLSVNSPKLYEQWKQSPLKFNQSMAVADVRGMKGAKMFSPKGIWRQKSGDPNTMEYAVPTFYSDGSVGETFVAGEVPRTKLSTLEQQQLQEAKMLNDLEKARINQFSFNSNWSPDRTKDIMMGSDGNQYMKSGDGTITDMSGKKVNLKEMNVTINPIKAPTADKPDEYAEEMKKYYPDQQGDKNVWAEVDAILGQDYVKGTLYESPYFINQPQKIKDMIINRFYGTYGNVPQNTTNGKQNVR